MQFSCDSQRCSVADDPFPGSFFFEDLSSMFLGPSRERENTYKDKILKYG